MKSIALLTVALALSFAGCRANGSQAPLERENRQLEDRVYELEYELEKLCDLYDECQGQNRVLTEQVEGGGTPPARRSPPLRPRGDAGAGSSGIDLGEPDVELGEPDLDALELDAPDADESLPETLPGPVDDGPLPDAPQSRRARAKRDDVQLAGHVEERAMATRLELTGLPAAVSADDPLAFFIEPRDDEGRRLATPGEISVVVMGQRNDGSAVEIAAWELTAEEAAACVRPTRRGERFYLELPWPARGRALLAAPSPLAVYVRYRTPDGEDLLAETALGVRSARDGATSRPAWSPTR